MARDLCLWSATQGPSLLVMREGPISQKLREAEHGTWRFVCVGCPVGSESHQDVAALPLCTGIRLRATRAGPGLVALGRTLAEAENLRIYKAWWLMMADDSCSGSGCGTVSSLKS